MERPVGSPGASSTHGSAMVRRISTEERSVPSCLGQLHRESGSMRPGSLREGVGWTHRGEPGSSNSSGGESLREDCRDRIPGRRSAGQVERGRMTVPVQPWRKADPVDSVEARDRVGAELAFARRTVSDELAIERIAGDVTDAGVGQGARAPTESIVKR